MGTGEKGEVAVVNHSGWESFGSEVAAVTYNPDSQKALGIGARLGLVRVTPYAAYGRGSHKLN